MKRNLLILYFFLLIGFVTFFNSLHNPFLIDDRAFFGQQGAGLHSAFNAIFPRQNPVPISNPLNDKIQLRPSATYYRPIADAVPQLSYAAFKDFMLGHRLVNLLLWVLAAWTLYLFLIQITSFSFAFWSSLLYLVHPINGITINYVTASVFSLEVIFMLLSLRLMIGVNASMFLNKSGQMILFIAALMCHESAFALPLYALALLMFGLKYSWGKALRSTLHLFVAAVLYWICLLNVGGKGGLFFNFAKLNASVLEYAASLTSLAWWYVSKLIWPDGITLMHAQGISRLHEMWAWAAVLVFVVAGIGWFIFKFRTTKPMAVLGLTWLSIGFLPMILAAAITPSQGVLIEPHWFIFSSIGFFIAIPPLFFKEGVRGSSRILFILLTCVLIFTSWQYNKVWGSEIGYCRFWHAHNPYFKSTSFFLANAYTEKGQYRDAEYFYRQCLMGRRKDWIVYTSIGHVYAQQGRYKDAKDMFQKAIGLEPRGVEAWTRMAMTFEMENDLVSASRYFEQGYALNPKDVSILWHLGQVLAKMGKYKEAQQYFIQADQIVGCSEKVMTAWLRMGISSRDKELTLDLAKRVTQCSTSPVLLTMAGSALGYYGMYAQAFKALNKALSIDPTFTDAKIEQVKWQQKQQQLSF